jgi:transposase
VLSEFRDRGLDSQAEALGLDTLLERCRALGWLPARGQQRTDSTHGLAAIRVLNRLALGAETWRAPLNELATVAPDWRCGIAPGQWYERYSTRIEAAHLPKAETKRHAYAQTGGADGCHLWDALEAPAAPAEVRALPLLET